MLDGNDPRLEELERLLNDPEVPMEPSRVWEILAEVSDSSQSGPGGA